MQKFKAHQKENMIYKLCLVAYILKKKKNCWKI